MSEEDFDWRRRGTCAQGDIDPDMWFAVEAVARRMAQHICLSHCEVLAECREETTQYPYRGVVMGGTIWADDNGRPTKHQEGTGWCVLCSAQLSRLPSSVTAG